MIPHRPPWKSVIILVYRRNDHLKLAVVRVKVHFSIVDLNYTTLISVHRCADCTYFTIIIDMTCRICMEGQKWHLSTCTSSQCYYTETFQFSFLLIIKGINIQPASSNYKRNLANYFLTTLVFLLTGCVAFFAESELVLRYCDKLDVFFSSLVAPVDVLRPGFLQDTTNIQGYPSSDVNGFQIILHAILPCWLKKTKNP